MTLNVYVMPIVGTGTKQSPRRPKYLTTFQSFSWGMFDYGDEPQCLVGVLDIDSTTDFALTSNADVFPAPQNLDTAVGSGAPLNRLRNGLEADDIPGTWIVSTTTYRQVIEFVGACCQYMQRFQGQGIGTTIFAGTTTLATTFGSLSATVQQAMVTAGQSFGFDTSAFTPAATLRTIIQNVANQYTATNLPLILAGVSLYTA